MSMTATLHACTPTPLRSFSVTPDGALGVLNQTADAIAAVLASLPDWGLAGTRAGQYRSDLAADEAAYQVLADAKVGVLSEESAIVRGDSDVMVLLDPVDGSTNAAARLPWYATSLCAVDGDGPLAALVVNLATGQRFDARRGLGSRCDGLPIAPSGCDRIGDALVALSGLPPHHLGWRQFRAMGACALDLCAVAMGAFDGYIDCSRDAHGVWDYAAGVMICREAGAVVSDAQGRELIVMDHAARRTPVAGATPTLHQQLMTARQW
jgi:myo-inositol-1(or 4)-monophosphatase